MKIKNSKKLENSVIAVVISALLLISMLALLSGSAIPSAKAQSVSGSTISQSLINDIYDSPAGNDSRSFAGIGPGPTTSNILWTVHIPNVDFSDTLADGFGELTAFGGYVFVVNTTDTIALDGGTGNIVYSIPTIQGSPEYIGGNYMLLNSNCYTVSTGTMVWTAPAGFTATQGTMDGGGALVTDPQYLPAPMFFCDGCGWELTNPSQPPTVLWNDTGKAQVPSGTGFAYDNGVMVYESALQTFSGFNAATGAYLWTVPADSAINYGGTAADGVFAWGSLTGTMYGWNITNGQLIWQFNPGTSLSMWSWSLGADYGMIYGCNEDMHFYAVNATTGKLVWSQSVADDGVDYTGLFTTAGGYIYVQMGENQWRNPDTGQYGHSEFCCYNAYNGDLVWSLPIEDGAPENAQCNAYGNLYIIPTTSYSEPGVYTYSTATPTLGGIGTLNEVICIGPGSAQSWPMYMGDPTHGSSGVGPTNLAVAWSKPIGIAAPLASSPVFANGIGYIGSTNKNIYAFNASDGDVIWNFTTNAGVESTPAVVNGYVYTGADDGSVYCLNAATGAKVWSVALPAGPAIGFGFEDGTEGPPSPIVVGSNLYIGDNDYLYCLSTTDGGVLWNFTWGPNAPLIATPTIANNVVYIAPDQGAGGTLSSIISLSTNCPDGFLYELNAQTGALIGNISIPYAANPFLTAMESGNFTSAVPGYQPGTLAYLLTGEGIVAPVTVDSADNIAFVQQMNMRTSAVSLTSGKILWTYDAYYDPGCPGEWGTDNEAGVLYAQGNCYFNEWYDIVCVNALTGNVTWTTWIDRESESPLSYYDGNLYAASVIDYVYVLNAATGAKESYAYCGTEPSQPVPYAGNLYVASGDFNITCYTQAAAQVTPITVTPTPTPTPTQTPSPTSPPTQAPLSLSPIGWSLLYTTIAIMITIIASVAIASGLIIRTMKKQKP